MPDITPGSALQKIRARCRELAARHGLGADVEAELCAHLEDKLTGYLNGTVRMSDEDALLLVNAHFGDAERVARAIGCEGTDVGPIATRRRWLRRAGTAGGALTGAAIIAASRSTAGFYWNVDRGLWITVVFATIAMCVSPAICAARVDPGKWRERIAGASLVIEVGAMFIISMWGVGGWGAAFRPSGVSITIAVAAVLAQATILLLLLIPIQIGTRFSAVDQVVR